MARRVFVLMYEHDSDDPGYVAEKVFLTKAKLIKHMEKKIKDMYKGCDYDGWKDDLKEELDEMKQSLGEENEWYDGNDTNYKVNECELDCKE